MQAIYSAAGSLQSPYMAQQFLGRATGNPNAYMLQLISWNDAPVRTHADVMAGFDRAIMLAKLEEESHA